MLFDFENPRISPAEKASAYKILESFTDREILLSAMMVINGQAKGKAEAQGQKLAKLYSPLELAREWGCSYSYVYDNIRAGKIKGIKIGKTWRISEEGKENFERYCAMSR